MIFTVDIHTHILPGVDDGAENFKEALEMLRIAKSNGTTDLVLTPHYLVRDSRSDGLSKREIKSRFNTFKEAAEAQCPGISLYLGAETFAVSNIEDVLDDDGLITVNNTNYVLLEFGFNDFVSRTLKITEVLSQNGYIPIIVHPERYLFIQRNPRDIIKYLEQGAILQVNTCSLAGYNGPLAQDVALSFLENGLASAIASDAHSTYQRVPDLSETYSFVSANFSSDYAEDLFYENPMTILKGKRL